MIKTLYKGSHARAAAILTALMLAGLTLTGMPAANATPTSSATSAPVTSLAEPQLLGRFVVGPQHSEFKAARPAGE